MVRAATAQGANVVDREVFEGAALLAGHPSVQQTLAGPLVVRVVVGGAAWAGRFPFRGMPGTPETAQCPVWAIPLNTHPNYQRTAPNM